VPLLAELWPDGLASKGGVDAFIAAARRHFAAFVDPGGGPGVRRLMGSADPRAAAQPIADLAALAADAPDAPGGFVDVLLFP